MVSLSKAEVLKLLNNQVKRLYRASLLSGIFFVIELIIVLAFFYSFKGFIMLISLILIAANYKRVESSCKAELGGIYLRNRFVCDKLSFFKIVERDRLIKCMIGDIRIDRLIKNQEYTANK